MAVADSVMNSSQPSVVIVVTFAAHVGLLPHIIRNGSVDTLLVSNGSCTHVQNATWSEVGFESTVSTHYYIYLCINFISGCKSGRVPRESVLDGLYHHCGSNAFCDVAQHLSVPAVC